MTKNLKIITGLSLAAIVAGASVYPIKLGVERYLSKSNSPNITETIRLDINSILEKLKKITQSKPVFDNLNLYETNSLKFDNQIKKRLTELKNNKTEAETYRSRIQNVSNLFDEKIFTIKNALRIWIDNVIDKNVYVEKIKLNQELTEDEQMQLDEFFKLMSREIHLKLYKYQDQINEYNQHLERLINSDGFKNSLIENHYQHTKALGKYINDSIILLQSDYNNLLKANNKEFEIYYKILIAKLNEISDFINESSIYLKFWRNHAININVNYENSSNENQNLITNNANSIDKLKQGLQSYQTLVAKLIDSSVLLQNALSLSTNSIDFKEQAYWSFINNYKKIIENQINQQAVFFNTDVTLLKDKKIQKLFQEQKKVVNQIKKDFSNSYNNTSNQAEKLSYLYNYIINSFWINHLKWLNTDQEIIQAIKSNNEDAILTNKNLITKNNVVLSINSDIYQLRYLILDLQNANKKYQEIINEMQTTPTSDINEDKRQDLIQKINFNKQEINKYDQQLQLKHKELNKQIDDYNNLLKTVDSNFTTINQLSKLLNILSALQNESLNNTKQQLRNITLLELNFKTKDDQIKDLNNNIGNLNLEKEKLNTNIRTLENNKEKLTANIKQIQEQNLRFQQEKEANLEIINAKNQELLDLKKQNDQTKSEILKTKNELLSLRQQKDELIKEQRQKQTEIEFLKQDGFRQSSEITQKNDEIRQLNNSINQLQQQIDNKNTQVTQLQNQNNALDESVRQKTSEIEELNATNTENERIIQLKNKELQKQNESLNSLNLLNSNLQQQKDVLTQQVNNLNTYIKSLKQENESKDQTIQDLQNQNNEKTTLIAAKQNEITALNEQKEALANENVQKQETIDTLRKNNESIKINLTKTNNELYEFQKSLNYYKNMNAMLYQQKKNLSDANSNNNAEIKKLKNDNDNLNAQLEDLQTRKKEIENEYNDKRRDAEQLNIQNDEYLREIEYLRKETRKKDDLISKYRLISDDFFNLVKLVEKLVNSKIHWEEYSEMQRRFVGGYPIYESVKKTRGKEDYSKEEFVNDSKIYINKAGGYKQQLNS
ncbi:hypothetical protein BCF59_0655 [Mycoplasmopsis mustelae]|uniref:Uncharacterized protein n=1 Tax=Mycoplasmopsis mustelae TaxID=171289 RepID=A0A4R7UC01_9BACT|nr:hypothetical protein [Mycoplasmopsis mustelae]TDV23032.1 hypothetical protein BCF59_0655 [Mycoplasmopsis mustelae]